MTRGWEYLDRSDIAIVNKGFVPGAIEYKNPFHLWVFGAKLFENMSCKPTNSFEAIFEEQTGIYRNLHLAKIEPLFHYLRRA